MAAFGDVDTNPVEPTMKTMTWTSIVLVPAFFFVGACAEDTGSKDHNLGGEAADDDASDDDEGNADDDASDDDDSDDDALDDDASDDDAPGDDDVSNDDSLGDDDTSAEDDDLALDDDASDDDAASADDDLTGDDVGADDDSLSDDDASDDDLATADDDLADDDVGPDDDASDDDLVTADDDVMAESDAGASSRVVAICTDLYDGVVADSPECEGDYTYFDACVELGSSTSACVDEFVAFHECIRDTEEEVGVGGGTQMCWPATAAVECRPLGSPVFACR